MRTPEQIKKLRKVLFNYIGNFGSYFTDEEVNAWADRLQNKLDLIPDSFLDNLKPLEEIWEIKVRLVGEENRPWGEISAEPKKHQTDFSVMAKSCVNLLFKFPQIHEILIRSVGHEEFEALIVRHDKKVPGFTNMGWIKSSRP